MAFGWLHRRIFEGINEAQREEMKASGMSFKDLARTMDLPAGVTYRVLHGKPPARAVPFIKMPGIEPLAKPGTRKTEAKKERPRWMIGRRMA